MNGLLAELKRRKVVRVAAVYAATAFVVLQAADLLAAGLALPTWVFPAITVLVIVGFPVALVLGWALELTPEGVRITRTASGPEAGEADAIPSLLGHRTMIVAGALVVLGMGLGAGWFLKPAVVASPDLFTPGAPPIAEKSVAVLAFADLSESGDQRWFAEGLAEEILTSLARLPELRVVGRNSSFLFTAGATDDLLIAETLGVAHLVKGSVRRVGERLRVTAQLVRAADGVQLWSEAYDRDAADLLDVQRDVAEQVAAALDVLLDEERRETMFAVGTHNVEAFEAYLRGRESFRAAHDGRGSLAEANVWFERAMALDPRFGRAALLHADRYAHRVIFGPVDGVAHASDVSVEDATDRLRKSLDLAASNAPDGYHRLLAEITREFFAPTWHRLPGLIDELRREDGAGVLPGDENWAPWVLVATGRIALARDLAERAVRADPLEPTSWFTLVQVEMAADDLDRARTLLAEARRTAGEHRWFHATSFFLSVLAGDRDGVLALGDAAPPWYRALLRGEVDRLLERARFLETEHEWPNVFLLHLYHELGDRERSRDLVKRIDALPTGSAILAVQIFRNGGALTFDLADAPNFSARLNEADVDLNSFRMMPRLSAPAVGGR